MAVQRGLQNHIVLVPDFDDSILIETKVNTLIYINSNQILYLPIISTGYDNTVVQIKFTVVNGSGRAFNEVGMTENSLHTFKLLTLLVEHSVFSLVLFRSSNLILLSD